MVENFNQEERDSFGDSQERPSKKIGKGQKFAAVILAIFAFFVIIMWSHSLKQGFSDPFTYKGEIPESEEECTGGNCELESELDLHMKDTDNDGLSDFDELNVYYTSPYLEDSDSDGYTDLEEINNQTDPNCPAGKECPADIFTSGQADSSGEAIEETSTSSNILNNDLITDDSDNSGSGETLDQIMSGSMTADQLRSLLLSMGFDEGLLNQTTDEELMRTYGEVLKQQQ